jgi:hypothetical protein
MHNSLFYMVVMLGTPAILVSLAVASRRRWACTIMVSIYSAFAVGFLWILPLFHAEPKLGPVYRLVTHFIPWEFPLLLVVPAFAIDLLLQRTTRWRPLACAPIAGLLFLGTFVAVQWPFASFLMTPLARNWFFGTAYMDFSTPATSLYSRHEFIPPGPGFVRGMFVAALISCFMLWLGLHAGRAMQRVKR